MYGVGVRPEYLVGRRLEHVVASWHLCGAGAPSGPLDVWLIYSEAVATHVTTGSDWRLIVETSAPFAEVAQISGDTPFADHLGEAVRKVTEEGAPDGGRLALEIAFGSGRVRCETWSGNLRLSST